MVYFYCYYDFAKTKQKTKYWEKLKILKIVLYLEYISTRKIIAIRELLLTAGLLLSYFNQLALSVYLYRCHPSEFLMASEHNAGIFSDHIRNAIAEIRNSK